MTEPKNGVCAATIVFLSRRASNDIRSSPKTSLSPQPTIKSWLQKFNHFWYSFLECNHRSVGTAKTKQSDQNLRFVVAISGSERGNILRWLLRFLLWGIFAVLVFFALYYAISAPPLHFFYQVGDDAGSATVYIPGGGFSGFWFHLGYLHSFRNQHNLYDYDYYCFSAGCLSLLSIFLNRTLDEVYDAALASQNAWMSGNRSRYEIVDHFFDELCPPDDCDFFEVTGGDTESLNGNTSCPSEVWKDDPEGVLSKARSHPTFLPRFKILVTTLSDGFEVVESRNRNELKENILRTTWVPYLTGWGFHLPDTTDQDSSGSQPIYLDGAFSRVLHPRCEVEWNIPLLWETLVHTFNPELSKDQVEKLWDKGRTYEYPRPRPVLSRNTADIAMNETLNAFPSN